MTTLVLDTHVLHWWSAEPKRISTRAAEALGHAQELVVADISWYELAWLARRERIVITIPLAAWLQRLARLVRTISVTPDIAATAASLPQAFPGDPADRLIYATAVENGWQLVTKDTALQQFKHPSAPTLW